MAAVVVTGLGHVGLPLAMRAVSVGHEVVGYDTDAIRVKRLEAGESYVEDVSACEIAAALNSGRFHPSADADVCTGFDVAVITVPTPLRDGLPDLAYLEAASRTLSSYLRQGSTVIVESTSFPGTTGAQVLTWLQEGSGLVAGTDFHLGYSPERVDPGNGSWTLAATPRIVSGIDEESLAAVQNFYHGIVDRTVPVSSPSVAELANLIENTFRHDRVADTPTRARLQEEHQRRPQFTCHPRRRAAVAHGSQGPYRPSSGALLIDAAPVSSHSGVNSQG